MDHYLSHNTLLKLIQHTYCQAVYNHWTGLVDWIGRMDHWTHSKIALCQVLWSLCV